VGTEALTSTIYLKVIFPLFELERNLLSYRVTNEKEHPAPSIKLLVICDVDLGLRKKKKKTHKNPNHTSLPQVVSVTEKF